MNAKEKAQELYGKHYQISMNSTNPKYRSSQVIKGHCIIYVKGIIEVLDIFPRHQMTSSEIERLDYWKQVLTELNQM